MFCSKIADIRSGRRMTIAALVTRFMWPPVRTQTAIIVGAVNGWLRCDTALAGQG